MRANAVLTELQRNPDSWQLVAAVLEQAQSAHTKIYGLSILEETIKYRWKALPREQCDAIKNVIVNLTINLSSNFEVLINEREYIRKLDSCLVQIIKQDWPHQWPTCIKEIVASSQNSVSLCANNLHILQLLSEEVFDFSAGQMTQSKTRELKESYNADFAAVFELCYYVLKNPTDVRLLQETLQTLLRFLSWIPLGYILETDLMDKLIMFLGNKSLRNSALQCLTEIASLNVGNMYDAHFEKLYVSTMTALSDVLNPNVPYEDLWDASEEASSLINSMALFLTNFFNEHISLLEKPDTFEALLSGHAILLAMGKIEEVELFKIVLEYFHSLAADIYNESPGGVTVPLLSLNSNPLTTSSVSTRKSLYESVLQTAIELFISRMPRPEEVLVVENDEGELIRETMKDSDSIALYKMMRDSLVYLTHLDPKHTESVMLERLNSQVDGSEWSWHNLNTLCWAVGSISGAMPEDEERKFLVTVIRELLSMCEQKSGKDNKAVIATNIMYVVGQYPRFLRSHWRFLKTVVNKLFEFMHEKFPGVQDMACDTFLKIASKCRKKFVALQPNESHPFVDTLLWNLPDIIADLQPAQVNVFYEAVGCMIQACTSPPVQSTLVTQCFNWPNSMWNAIILEASSSQGQSLYDMNVVKKITNILRINISVCTSIGHVYYIQLRPVYLDVLNVYKAYSQRISVDVASGGQHATKTVSVRGMRTVKASVLTLLKTLVEKGDALSNAADAAPESAVGLRRKAEKEELLPLVEPLLGAVLYDYRDGHPTSRDPEVLYVMAAFITTLQDYLSNDLMRIMEAVFQPTLVVITQDMDSYLEIRLGFYTLLRAVMKYCSAPLLMNEQNFELIRLFYNAILWGVKHTERNVAQLSLNALEEMLLHLEESPVRSTFYSTLLLPLIQDILVVLTDTFHKPGFSSHALILTDLFNVASSDNSFRFSEDPSVSNAVFVRNHVGTLLCSSFPNLTESIVARFVDGLFNLRGESSQFKGHLRDFLVQLKEFGGDNTDLYDDERQAQLSQQQLADLQMRMAVPGLVAPYDPSRDAEKMDD